MSKPKVLLVGDHGLPTGFELVTRSIGEALVKSERFDLVARGIGYTATSTQRVYPWPVTPASHSLADPLGLLKARRWVEEESPDCVVFVNDLWNVAAYLSSCPAALPTVAYYPVDTPNLRWSSALAVGAISVPVAYTQFGATETARAVRAGVEVLQKAHSGTEGQFSWLTVPHDDFELHLRSDRLAYAQEPGYYKITPHGLDHAAWRPLDQAACRRAFGLPLDAFIVTNVNTNQFRKRLDTTIRAFAHFAKLRKDALLVLHCSGGERDGWDLAQLAQLYGVSDRVVHIHAKRPYLTDQELLLLYNTADLNINTSGGEGWGLNSFHSAACGVPQALPSWSNNTELWATDEALHLPVVDYRHEPRGLNTAHALLDARCVGEMLLELSESPTRLSSLRDNALAVAARQRSWESVGQDFVQYVEGALNESTPTPLALEEWSQFVKTPLDDPLSAF